MYCFYCLLNFKCHICTHNSTKEKKKNRLKFRQVKRIPTYHPHRVGHISNKHKVESQGNIPVEIPLKYEMQWSLWSIWMIYYMNKHGDFKRVCRQTCYHSLQRINILISGLWRERKEEGKRRTKKRKEKWSLVFLAHFPATVTSLEWWREIQEIHSRIKTSPSASSLFFC